MPEPVEVAILTALLSRAQAFADAQGLTISMPNVAFTPPTAGPSVKYLRATVMPAPSVEAGISFDAHVQHLGLMQIDTFAGITAGEPAAVRIASAAIAFFKRGSKIRKDDITVRFDRPAYRGSLMIDGVWAMLPVTIPYQCFARPA